MINKVVSILRRTVTAPPWVLVSIAHTKSQQRAMAMTGPTTPRHHNHTLQSHTTKERSSADEIVESASALRGAVDVLCKEFSQLVSVHLPHMQLALRCSLVFSFFLGHHF